MLFIAHVTALQLEGIEGQSGGCSGTGKGGEKNGRTLSAEARAFGQDEGQ